MTTKIKAVIVLSGGLDSSVLLYWMKARGFDCRALSVNYGQRHHIELDRAIAIADAAQVEHEIADMTCLSSILRGNSLINREIRVPHGHYEAESMKATVVPNRNMLLLAIAAAVAIREGASVVSYGAHAGDHAIYPDCRPEFTQAMRSSIAFCGDTPIDLITPFEQWKKFEIVDLGFKLNVPFELTWSCYEGVPPDHCGACGTCVERREAFRDAFVPDPTTYRAESFLPTINNPLT